MSLIVLFGPQASGKMTVGKALTNITDYKLFYNHMTIDFVGQIFKPERVGKMWEFEYIYWDLISKIYDGILRFALVNNINMIYTLVWDFTNPNIMRYMTELEKEHRQRKSEVYFVELECDIEERLKRNVTEERLRNKPPKRDTLASEASLRNEWTSFRLHSNDGEMQFKNYIKINNTNLKPEEVALIIKKKFKI